MKAAPLVVVMVAAAISVAAQQKRGKIVSVAIIVGTHASNETRCANTKQPVSATSVLVDSDNKNDVHHCVNGKLLNHGDENKQPDLFKSTLVQLEAGDSIRWTANEPFRVTEVKRHAGAVAPGAPHYPFLEPLPTAFSERVTVGDVLDLSYPVVQRYKVTFQFKTIGLVDPDFVCSM